MAINDMIEEIMAGAKATHKLPQQILNVYLQAQEYFQQYVSPLRLQNPMAYCIGKEEYAISAMRDYIWFDEKPGT